MNLNGWQKLWIVVSLLSGIGFGYYTVKIVPEVPRYIKLDWIKSVSGVMAEGLLDNNSQPVTIRQVYNDLYDKYKTLDAITASFEEMAEEKIKDKAKREVLDEIALLNQRYKEKLADPNKNTTLYMAMIISWLLTSTVLYVLGNLIGWIIRKFKK